jgi:hypothetical protein
MRFNLLAMAASMVMPFVRFRAPKTPELPYRSSRETMARSLSREDRSLMGQHYFPR